ncbi:MAG: DUF6323 family protein [Candidatus Onthomonas sp.]
MDTRALWMPELNRETLERQLTRCNARSAPFGLTLTGTQMEQLALSQRKALRDTGRIEFGGGVLERLVAAFCDAPDLDPACYAETLDELQTLFYQLKGVCREQLSDSELLTAMRQIYDGTGGSLEALAGADRETLLEIARTGRWERPELDWGEEDD